MKAISGKQFCSLLESHGWMLRRISAAEARVAELEAHIRESG